MNRKLSVLILTAACLFLATACSNGNSAQSDQQATEVVINTKLLNVSGNSADALLDTFNQAGHIETGKVNSDGTVSLYMTEEELVYWKEQEVSYLENINNRMQEKSPGYALKYDDSHSYVQLYYNQQADEADVSVWLMTSECYSALYQLFDHPDSDWYVSIEIYNSDTGMLVASGDSNASFSYDDDDWAVTYTDDWKADYPENTVYIDFSAEVLSYFGQSRESLTGFLESYSDYYLTVQPTAEAVTMAVDPDRMADLIVFNRKLMQDEQEYFAALYDGYKIVYSDNCTDVELWYDNQISDSDMAVEAVETFLLAVMDQCLEAENGAGWKLNVKIYNKNTGELKKDESIPGEDLYIINQSGW